MTKGGSVAHKERGDNDGERDDGERRARKQQKPSAPPDGRTQRSKEADNRRALDRLQLVQRASEDKAGNRDSERRGRHRERGEEAIALLGLGSGSGSGLRSESGLRSGSGLRSRL